MIRKQGVLAVLCMLYLITGNAQSSPEPAAQLFYRMRDKIGVVKDYVASVRLKIDVSFMRVPMLDGKLYFKSPDKLRLERNGGLSILPKKSINLTLNNLIPSGTATVIDAGYDSIAGRKVRVIQVIPQGETDIVLTKVWVDEARLLALRAETTTRENGTVRMDLQFNRYAQYSLPDRVVFYLDVKEYKVPKGVTMDYDDGTEAVRKVKTLKKGKGRIEIAYLNYRINTGLSDAVFRER